MQQIFDFINAYPALVLAVGGFFIELIIRKWPSVNNYSPLDNFKKLIDWIIANKRKPDPADVVSPTDPTKNVVEVPRDKFL